jgi:cytochrome c oxidase subunit IV
VAHETTTPSKAERHAGHGPGRYFVVWALLIIFTITTVVTGRMDLGSVNLPLALTIATIKATLVVLFFMHVRYSTRLTWAVVLGALFWLGILLALTMSDYLSRGWIPQS